MLVALVVDFDDDIAIAVVENPNCRVVHGGEDGSFIRENSVLRLIKISENHDHAEFIRAVKDTCESGEVFGAQ